jgi:hypothetical protein
LNFLGKWASGSNNDGSVLEAGSFGSVVSSVEISGNTIFVGDFGNQTMHKIRINL